MDIFKLEPYYSEKVWGYEEWNLSTHRNGNSIVSGSEVKLIDELKNELPILIKIIQANEKLSVQVHPHDEYSRKYENDNGKTECWYILEADENASLICGIKDGLDKESFAKVIASGTVHAIEEGLKLIEVQQSSDVTYRIYDWGRDREMHIEKSLDVIDYDGKNKGGKIEDFEKLETPYFTVEKIDVKDSYKDLVDKNFHSYTVINGTGVISDGNSVIDLNKEETVYIKEGINYSIEGNLELIKSYV